MLTTEASTPGEENVTWPLSPSRISLPVDAVMVSLPLPPSTMLLPAPTVMASLPPSCGSAVCTPSTEPVLRISSTPGACVTVPRSPMMMALPLPSVMVSLPGMSGSCVTWSSVGAGLVAISSTWVARLMRCDRSRLNPLSPKMMSLPPPPVIVSAPEPPAIQSPAGPPVITSLPGPPYSTTLFGSALAFSTFLPGSLNCRPSPVMSAAVES